MNLCAECKGRGFCGRSQCPITQRFYASLNLKRTDSYMGEAPSVFVGSARYPHVTGGPLLTSEIDSPPQWVQRNYTIEDIVGIRARTIRNTSAIRHLESAVQEVALSSTPLDVEASFARPLTFDLAFDGTLAPVGLGAAFTRLSVLDNAHTERPIDRVTSDTDLRAADAVRQLFHEGIDVYHISELLTAGLLGVKRHIVPTRWSITAVDDMVGNHLKQEIIRHAHYPSIEVFAGELHANQLIIVLIPGDWKFEMIEIWEKQSLWSQGQETILCDGEGMRKSAYSPIAGAYYSARLAVVEYLQEARRSARALVVRRITGDYWAPLGTWVIREAARSALSTTPVRCESLVDAENYVTFLLNSEKWKPYSRLIPELKSQKTIFDF